MIDTGRAGDSVESMHPVTQRGIMRLELQKDVLLARLDEVTSDVDRSIERLDGLTRELDEITGALDSIDDLLRTDDGLLAAS